MARIAMLVALAWISAISAFAGTNSCVELRGRTVSELDFSLPTHAATITSARTIKGAGGGFCKVRGEVHSVDSQADPIRFEVNLPDIWNHKAVQFGGGAFNGYLRESDGLRATVVGDKRQLTPLQRGYVTFGGDSGHHHRYLFLPDALNAVSAKFALNDEERKNFASDGLKKTHDVAVAIMKMRYGGAPARMYFIGGSTGGREAMKVVDRWPVDYDGVMAAYAAWNQIESDLQFVRVSQALYAKGPNGQSGWLSRAKTRLLRDAVLKVCDGQDGLADTIVSNPAGCHFDAATLRCLDGRDHRGCLSDGQERTIAAFATPQVSAFKVANGMDTEPGYNVLRGADLVNSTGLLKHPFRPPVVLLNSFYYVVASGVLRFFLIKDAHFDALTFDPQTGGPAGKWIPGILKQSLEDDGSVADLSPFQQRGGKLLLVHGTADATIPTDASVLLYQRIVHAMGQPVADSFLRLYLIPGYDHGRGIFNAGFDTVGVLDAWADKGIVPAQLVVSDQNKGTSRTRPLCAWPAWPAYRGGNVNVAASFACE